MTLCWQSLYDRTCCVVAAWWNDWPTGTIANDFQSFYPAIYIYVYVHKCQHGSNLKDSNLVRHAQSNIIRLWCRPLGLIHFTVTIICEQRRVELWWDFWSIPNDPKAIICATQKVIAGVRSPRDWIDAWIMIRKCCQGNWWPSDVNQIYTWSIHRDGGNVICVEFVPSQSQEWRWWRRFVNNGGVVQVSLIKDPDWTICSHRRKKTVNMRKGDVVHSFVMSNELCFDLLLLQIPNRAGCVDRRSPKFVVTHTAPVKWCQRRQVCGLLLCSRVCKLCYTFHLTIFHFPQI